MLGRAAQIATGTLRRFSPSEAQVLVVSGMAVGAGAAVAGITFRELLDGCIYLFSEVLGPVLSRVLGSPGLALLPALGGLVVGLLTYLWARGARGPGVPEVIDAVARRGGRMPVRLTVVRVLCAAISIGSGGSMGRHGPTARFGALLGSLFGRFLKMSDERTRTLVGCGAAGGIAATFNAPIAGVFYALEVILGEFTTRAFGVVVIASVTAAAIGRGMFGDAPAFTVPPYELLHPSEFALYALLGIFGGIVGVALTRIIYGFQDAFYALPLPDYLRPALGGLLLGVLGFFLPQILGIGYPVIDQALGEGLGLRLLAVLIVAKIVAVALTLGSGGAGGVFAPALFVGGLLGTAFGLAAQALLPGLTAPPGAYALVGMGAVFAGTVRAPITAVLIMFELTGTYAIILPLMAAVVISTQVSEAMSADTIYTLKLRRKGIDVRSGRDVDLLKTIEVGKAMTQEVPLAASDVTLREASEHLNHSRSQVLVVIDEEGALFGMVTEQDVRAGLLDEKGELTLAEIATRDVLSVYPDENLNEAIHRMGIRDLGQLPVVERSDRGQVVGMLRRGDIFHAYSAQMLEQAEQNSKD
ncbi:MAG: chloride channel protein [Dehalococcoidia bacterium]|nr:chloride channel protein [Dehalococcoidia bacterium]